MQVIKFICMYVHAYMYIHSYILSFRLQASLEQKIAELAELLWLKLAEFSLNIIPSNIEHLTHKGMIFSKEGTRSEGN